MADIDRADEIRCDKNCEVVQNDERNGKDAGDVNDFFFFSSRRRHTRSLRDWSSDVCSSDLVDGSTGGRIDGMIAAADRVLSLVDADTKIVPGHGPLATKADLARYRDMLSQAADRVRKLKASGKSLEDAIAAKPFADLDADWGKGTFNGDGFVKVVYLTL